MRYYTFCEWVPNSIRKHNGVEAKTNCILHFSSSLTNIRLLGLLHLTVQPFYCSNLFFDLPYLIFLWAYTSRFVLPGICLPYLTHGPSILDCTV